MNLWRRKQHHHRFGRVASGVRSCQLCNYTECKWCGPEASQSKRHEFCHVTAALKGRIEPYFWRDER